MTKINSDLPVILIDTSYWLYYRFFSLRNLYSHAYPENYVTDVTADSNVESNVPANVPANFNANHNWLEDELFMTKYKKLFVDNIKKLCKKFKTKLENVILCIDCPHNEIWRHIKVKTENEKINIKNEIIKQKKIEKEKKEKEKVDDGKIDDGKVDEGKVDDGKVDDGKVGDGKIDDGKVDDGKVDEGKVDEGNVDEDIDEAEESIIENIKPYKGTRLESHKKNNFNSFNIFNYMKTTFIPTIKDNNNNTIKIIHCSKCEADDIIGQLSVYLDTHLNKQVSEVSGLSVLSGTTKTQNQKKIYILANDNDYLQVCNKNIKLINGIGKIISGDKGDNYYGDKYLISKILLGDKSDNIKSCSIDSGYIHCGIPNNKIKNVTKKCIEIILSNPDKYTIFNTLLNDIRNNKELDINYSDINIFRHNCNMMDFQMLPQELKQNLYTLFSQII